MPDRDRVLKAAADGVNVVDPHDRNPVTGDGMPSPNLIVDPNGRKWPNSGVFASQFIIADDQGPAPAADSVSDQPRRRDGRKRQPDAQIRMFNKHTAVVGFSDESPSSPHPSDEQEQRPVENKSTSTDKPCRKASRPGEKRHVRPMYKECQQSVLAWSKSNGNVENFSCYIGHRPLKQRGDASNPNLQTTTGIIAVRSNTELPPRMFHTSDKKPEPDDVASRNGSPVDDDDDSESSEDEEELTFDGRRSA